MSEQLDFIRRGGQTRRFHTFPVIQQQNVAEHSHGVAMLVSWLAQASEPGLGVPLLMAALCHDLAEHVVGDIPSPAKKAMPDYPPTESDVAGAAPTGGGTFSAVFGKIETDLLDENELMWEHLLNETEKRWLALADVAECGLFCIRERMMGNKMLESIMENVMDYMGRLLLDSKQKPTERERELLMYIGDEWEKAND